MPPSSVCPEKIKSLESSERKRQSSEAISDVDLQATISLAGLSQKKMKKAVKKIATAEVRRVPSTFDDDIVAEPSRKGFLFCPWPDLRFNACRHSTPSSENDFVDVETFSDDSTDVQKGAIAPVAAVVDKVSDRRPSGSQEQASLEFVKELEMTIHWGRESCAKCSICRDSRRYSRRSRPFSLDDRLQ
jgi:hypothetical protein